MAKKSTKFYADILPANQSGNDAGAAKKLIERGELLKERYETRDSILDEVEKYYYDTGVQKSKDGEIYYVSVNDAQATVDLIADLLSSQGRVVTVPAMSESAKAKAEANDQERWLDAWISMSEREEDMRLAHEMAQDISLRGAAVIRVMMLDERLPKKGKKTSEMKNFPLVPEVRDYRYCYPVYKRTKLVEVFECYEAKVGDIRIDWPKLTLPDTWKAEEEVMVWEWWSEDKKAFWVSGTTYSDGAGGSQNEMWLMRPTKHSYGVLPYSIRAMRPQGKKRNDPEKMAPSLLQSWSGVLEVMNLVESAKLSAAMSYINSAWVVYTNRTDFDLDLTQGAVNYLYPEMGEKVEPIVKSETPVDLMEIGEQWASKFQKASVPGALFGEDIGPNMAGYAISLLNESGRRILIPIVHALEGCLADACGIALAIGENLLGPTLENSDETMEIFVTHEDDSKRKIRKGVTLDWKNIEGMFMVEVSLGDPMPQDDERNLNMAMAARQPNASGMPLLSDESIRAEILDRSDDEREVTRILKERLIVEAAQVIAEETAIEAGLMPDPAEEEAAAMQEQAMMQQQAALQQPQPAQPPVQPQAMPMPGPDPQTMQVIDQLGQKVMQLEQALMSLMQPPPPEAAMMPGQEEIPPEAMDVQEPQNAA